MTKHAQALPSEVIEDFRAAIRSKRTNCRSPSKQIIDFRNETDQNYERDVWEVPLYLLRYRKENGRIASSVLSYEKSFGTLSLTDQNAQDQIAKFLQEKDPEKTKELEELIRARGQREPGIITSDGFIIDGNRRRYVLGQLQGKFPSEARFKTMKVVILPGPGEPGGPPSITEIERIENRYQLQGDGKADYFGFDAALSMKQKELRGYPLEDQLRDDPKYQHLGEREFKQAVKKKKRELLDPIKCVDRYLSHMDRDQEYDYIAANVGDSHGRWQAFIDYSKFWNQLSEPRKREDLNIDEHEIGKIEQAAFNIIRLREIPSAGKVHVIMRSLPKFCKHAKEPLLEIERQIPEKLPNELLYGPDGEKLKGPEIEERWRKKYLTKITSKVKQMQESVSDATEINKPLDLLKQALQKLNHDHLDTTRIPTSDLQDAQRLTNRLHQRSDQLRREIYDRIKSGKPQREKDNHR